MNRFITFEGMDGAGKSTHLKHFVETLRQRGHEVVQTHEPGGTPLGEQLRAMLLAQAMSSGTEALLMFAARNEHLEQVIRPALAEGRWVVSDRFSDASFAYQGGGRGMPWDKLAQLEQWVHPDLQPDLTLYFDVSVEVARARLTADRDPDRFEQEAAAFFERVREGYLRRIEANPQRYALIDAGQSMESVRAQVQAVLERL